jgi:hypothetical protein
MVTASGKTGVMGKEISKGTGGVTGKTTSGR